VGVVIERGNKRAKPRRKYRNSIILGKLKRLSRRGGGLEFPRNQKPTTESGVFRAQTKEEENYMIVHVSRGGYSCVSENRGNRIDLAGTKYIYEV